MALQPASLLSTADPNVLGQQGATSPAGALGGMASAKWHCHGLSQVSPALASMRRAGGPVRFGEQAWPQGWAVLTGLGGKQAREPRLGSEGRILKQFVRQLLPPPCPGNSVLSENPHQDVPGLWLGPPYTQDPRRGCRPPVLHVQSFRVLRGWCGCCPLSWAGGCGGQEGVTQAPDKTLEEAGGVGHRRRESPLRRAHPGPPSLVTSLPGCGRPGPWQ